MKFLNRNNNDDADVRDQELLTEDVDLQGQDDPVSEKKPRKSVRFNKVISDVLGGDVFSRDGFVSLVPFFFYILIVIFWIKIFFPVK